MPVNTGYFGSGQTTDLPSNLSVRQGVRIFSTLSADGAATLSSTLAVTGALTLSAALNSASAISGGAITGTTVTGTQFSASSADFMSVNTAANASSMTRGELRLVFLASGISLVYSSGASSYVIGQSTQSVAQA